MNESILERIQSSAKALKIDLYTAELASYADEKELTPEALEAVCGVFEYLEQKKYDSMVHTMLKLSNTRMFFDVIDRRYNKDGPSTMIFTSNKTPNQWGEYFSEDDTLLCSLDRVFDDATVFMIKGDSYRGRKLETLGLEAGIAKHTEYKNA